MFSSFSMFLLSFGDETIAIWVNRMITSSIESSCAQRCWLCSVHFRFLSTATWVNRNSDGWDRSTNQKWWKVDAGRKNWKNNNSTYTYALHSIFTDWLLFCRWSTSHKISIAHVCFIFCALNCAHSSSLLRSTHLVSPNSSSSFFSWNFTCQQLPLLSLLWLTVNSLTSVLLVFVGIPSLLFTILHTISRCLLASTVDFFLRSVVLTVGLWSVVWHEIPPLYCDIPIMHYELVRTGLQATRQSAVQESLRAELYDSCPIWLHALCVYVISYELTPKRIQREHGRGK